MPWIPLIAMGVGAAAGAIANSGDKTQTTTRTAGPQTALGAMFTGGLTAKEQEEYNQLLANWREEAENYDYKDAQGRKLQPVIPERMRQLMQKRETTGEIGRQYGVFSGMVDAGPGILDIRKGAESQRGLADLYREYSEGGFIPGQEDIDRSQTLAQSLFNPQRVAMQQAFQDQSTEANRRAAVMGRSMNDPILAAKLAQEQTRQSAMLEAQQGAYATQYAQSLPFQRLAFREQETGTLAGLAQQAMANRQTLLATGMQIGSGQQNFQLGTGTTTTVIPGSWQQSLAGGLAGAGMGASVYGAFNQPSMGGGGMGGGGMGGGGGGFNSAMPFSGGRSSGNFWSSNPYSD